MCVDVNLLFHSILKAKFEKIHRYPLLTLLLSLKHTFKNTQSSKCEACVIIFSRGMNSVLENTSLFFVPSF